MKHKYCITCEVNNVTFRKLARHYINLDGVELGFCDIHYDDYLNLEEFSIDLIEQNYGDNSTED